MITMLQNWKGTVEINGTEYNSIEEATSVLNTLSGDISIKLHTRRESASNNVVNTEKQTEYRITVKKYMTQEATPDFDFMAKWNNNTPMPLRTMIGTVEKETRGMVYMKLHGDIYAEKICTCMRCGKRLTNKVSQYFGIGPECGGHNYVNPFEDEEQLKEAVEEYRRKLQKTTWEGWIIKSAITEQEEVSI